MKSIIPCLLAAFASVACLHAQEGPTALTRTETDGEWVDLAKWSGQAMPTAADPVRIDKGASLLLATPDRVCRSLRLDDKGILTIGPEGKLVVGQGDAATAESANALQIATETAGMLQIRGGSLSVNGALRTGGDLDAIAKIVVSDNGRLTLETASLGVGAAQLDVSTGGGIRTTGAANHFGAPRNGALQALFTGGHLATAGVDHWTAAHTKWTLRDGSYQNGQAIRLADGEKTNFQGEISGEAKCLARGDLVIASGVDSHALLIQKGGRTQVQKAFAIAPTKGATGALRIVGGVFQTEKIQLGGPDNSLAELQIQGSEGALHVQTVSCRGTASLSFVTDAYKVMPLHAPVFVDLRSAQKAILKVDLRTLAKQGSIPLIVSPRLNGKFTHVEITHDGKTLTPALTQTLGSGDYALDYNTTGLTLRYHLPAKR